MKITVRLFLGLLALGCTMGFPLCSAGVWFKAPEPEAQQLQLVRLSCFKAYGIIDLPQGIEPVPPALEGGLVIPGPPGTCQALFFPSTTAICSSPLHDLGNLLIHRKGWSITEDAGRVHGFAQVPGTVHEWLGLYMGVFFFSFGCCFVFWFVV